MLKRRLQILRLQLCRGGYSRARYLKKLGLFHRQGEHCFFIPSNYGTEPYLLSFGDNVHVASDVSFITHDVTAKMFGYLEPEQRHTSRVGRIDVGSHVFIGARATILYDVKIGDRVIVAAGSLVNRDLPSGGIYAGVPARRIGNFEDYAAKSREYSCRVPWKDAEPLQERRRKQLEYLYTQEDETC